MRFLVTPIILVLMLSAVSSFAGAISDADFKKLYQDLDSNDFATREAATDKLKDLIGQSLGGNGLTEAQLDSLRSAANAQKVNNADPTAEQTQRAQQVMQVLADQLKSAVNIKKDIGLRINPPGAFTQTWVFDQGIQGQTANGDAAAIAVRDDLEKKIKAVETAIDAANPTQVSKSLDALKDFVSKVDVNKLGVGANNQKLADKVTAAIDSLKAYSDDIKSKFGNQDPGNRQMQFVPQNNGPFQLNEGKTIQVTVGGVTKAGFLDTFAYLPGNQTFDAPASYEFVSPIFDLTADDSLAISGPVSVSMEFSLADLLPGTDPSGLRIVRLANTSDDFLTGSIDSQDLLATGSYQPESYGTGLDQFGEFALVEQVPEPSADSFIGLALLLMLSGVLTIRRTRHAT